MLRGFLQALQAATPANVFNPWTDHDGSTDLAVDAPARRRARLMDHLAIEARYVLVGEAVGYQGCKVSGIPFTSERLILEGAIPRVAVPCGRLSTRPLPWSEPSATTVWKTLRALGIAEETVLWNAYPWHPHRLDALHSNRTPSGAERTAGVPVLHAMLALHPGARIFAVGRNAERSLAELGIEALPLRHPSMGGAKRFAEQLRVAVKRR